MTGQAIEIRPLAPGTLSDFLGFFDTDAFADNPRWAFCYCQCFYVDHAKVEWNKRTAAENRADAIERSRCGAMQGYLAYLDGKPVGWCNAAPWKLVTSLHDEPEPLSDKLGEIVCFVVAKPYRRRGVARALLDAACAGLREQGMEIAEAYTKPDAEGDAANHHGPLQLYLDAGFAVHRESGEGGVYLRKPLAQLA